MESTNNTPVGAAFSMIPMIANTIVRNVDTTAARAGDFLKGTATAMAKEARVSPTRM